MTKQFTIITKDGSKWLRPINPHPEKLSTHGTPEAFYYNPEWQEFEKNNFDAPYLGSHPEGTTLDEIEVREVGQHKIGGKWHVTTSDLYDTGFSDYWGLETRIAYTDAEPSDMHINDIMETEEQLAYKSLEEIHKHTTLCTNDDEENLFVVGFIYGLRRGKSHDRHISDDYPGVDYQPLFNHMSKVHGLTLTTSEMDEIIGLSTYILAKK